MLGIEPMGYSRTYVFCPMVSPNPSMDGEPLVERQAEGDLARAGAGRQLLGLLQLQEVAGRRPSWLSWLSLLVKIVIRGRYINVNRYQC